MFHPVTRNLSRSGNVHIRFLSHSSLLPISHQSCSCIANRNLLLAVNQWCICCSFWWQS